MKKMRTLLTSFSLAALFSLATACAVDPDSVETQTEESESLDDVELEADDVRDAAELPSRDSTRNLRDLDNYIRLLDQPYCEQSYDCESNICDQEINRCRDYPF